MLLVIRVTMRIQEFLSGIFAIAGYGGSSANFADNSKKLTTNSHEVFRGHMSH